ncbi:PQ loop repeat-domain-containing protein [Cercophora newfieldiana]|uniref:PQ loop repeat-domain-containing protein n=1 Tax=Cercophora newfieldiana TaxID=92897 RepID=A0AA39Y4N5_9PEZI|nr:PQ loop repeat-domain-containing protein [Cercophora newfieldiana]
MAPPTDQLHLDVEAISGICGSISIACWVVVFSPQIVENFRRSSAEGLSIQFIVIWLAGDVFNILGAVLQGVLPTMVILAIYYTIADLVLLAQCFYYRGFTLTDTPSSPPVKPRRRPAPPTEHTALLSGAADPLSDPERRGSSDWTHLSPAVPLVVDTPPPPPTKLQVFFSNSTAVLMVCAAGVAGWWLSREYGSGAADKGQPAEPLCMDFWGQVFGWLCAVLYLGSRLPQLLLNFRRKSTDGVSMLFFLFACLGNMTYVLSILAYGPECAGEDGECRPGEAAGLYWRYILVNLSWLAGSAGTLGLDFAIFVQFFLYSKGDDDESEDGSVDGEDDEDEEESIDGERWDQRPVLERNQSDFA